MNWNMTMTGAKYKCNTVGRKMVGKTKICEDCWTWLNSKHVKIHKPSNLRRCAITCEISELIFGSVNLENSFWRRYIVLTNTARNINKIRSGHLGMTSRVWRCELRVINAGLPHLSCSTMNMKYLTTKITKKYWTSMFSPHVESQVKTKAYQVKRPVSWVYHLTSSLFLIKKLSQAKEKIFYLRCDPWRAGRGQEFGPVGRQLFIPGRWYHGDNMISWYLTSDISEKSSRLRCQKNIHFDVLHAKQIESNLFAK